MRVVAAGNSLGRVQRKVTVSGATLIESAYAPGTNLPYHSHQRAHICFIIKGSYSEGFGEQTRECRRSLVTVHPEGEAHSQRFTTNTNVLTVEFSPEFALQVGGRTSVFSRSHAIQDAGLHQLLLRLLYESCLVDSFSTLAIKGLLYQIVARAARAVTGCRNAETPEWLEGVRRIVEENFKRRLRLEHLSSISHRHYVHVAQAFKARYGLTIGEYQRALRLEFARNKLFEGGTSLSDIALECGFADQSHFSKAFKMAFGVTPLEYRRHVD